MIKLSKEQVKHYDSIKWFFDENPRKVGRTTLLILVLVELALSGKKIYLNDYHSIPYIGQSPMLREKFIDQVIHFIQENNIRGLVVNRANCILQREK